MLVLLLFQGYCYDQAVKFGIQHAQLPISDFVTISGRKVLAVNHGIDQLLPPYCYHVL